MIKLNNGVMMPGIGFGTWQINSSEVIKNAIENGYRMIDTAPSYENESIVGEAIRSSSVNRSELFVVTKLRTEDQGYEPTVAAFEKSLQQLGLDYLDLYLIHHPTANQQRYLESWRAMEKLYKDGKIRAIGVSNFWPAQLHQIQNIGTIKPMVNQIQTSPYRQQKAIRKYCTANYIVVQSSAPLAEGNELLRDKVIVEIASKLAKSPAQIILRWHLQSGLTPIPKAVGSEHQRQNLQVYDFELSPDDFNKINNLNRQIQSEVST